jgi:hypothetical protein
MWPLAAINQVRGFVSNSISTFRSQMNQLFHTSYSSATLAAPQQFESILHSRLSTQIPSLQTSFTATFGAIPAAGAASPQDRVMMDIDDSLGQENLKTTLIADQAQDSILQTADQMENQVAVSTPGSNHTCKRCLPPNSGRKLDASRTTTFWSNDSPHPQPASPT